MEMLNVLAGIAWDPQIRGILTVVLGFSILGGSVYLIVATNTGARLGLLISLAGLFGWMTILTLFWWLSPPGIGPAGDGPSWVPVEVYVDGQAPAKARRGFIGALGWHEQNLSGVIEELPARDLSLFEVALFCLVDHLRTRESVPLSPYPGLVEFADRFSVRDSARRTPYRFDVPSD